MYLNETFKKNETKLLVLLVSFLIFFSLFTFDIYSLPQDSIKVIAKSPEAEAASIYQIEFRLSKPLSPKGVIQIKFPKGFDLSNLQVAGSSTINGGFDLKVEDQTVILKRSGLGRLIKANEKADVKFAIVKNPSTPEKEYELEIEILNENNLSLIKNREKIKIMPRRK